MTKRKGKLIIIEGIDGSGKATQTKKLVEKLKQEGKHIETISFPRHGQKFFGILVDQYLNNKFGDATKIDPHIASLLYACDRWEVKSILDNWLQQDKIVVLDRYATSNKGHQLSKIKNPKKYDEFLGWLDELEYQIFKIPRPDLVIYLDVNINIVLGLINKRSRENKKYINGDKDGHEKSTQHLAASANAYKYLCQKYNNWYLINCVKNNKLLNINQIHNKIWQLVKNKI